MSKISKEEILQKNHTISSPVFGYIQVDKSMDEYAKQEAIAFAEWCAVNKYYFLGREWSILENNVATGKTTEQLYSLFLEQK